MLTEQQLKDFGKLQEKASSPWIIGSVCWMFLTMGGLGFFLEHDKPIPTPAGLLILVPPPILILIGFRRTSRFHLLCPHCLGSIEKSLDLIRMTRTCPHCETQLLEGRVRSLALVQRYRQFRYWYSERDIHMFPWVWVGIQTAISIMETYQPHSFLMAPIFGLIGIGLATYCWFRTGNHRCVYPLIASLTICSLSTWRLLNYHITTP